MQLLIEKGANVMAKDSIGQIAWDVEFKRGPKTTMLLLVKKGADIESKYKIGRIPTTSGCRRR